MATLIHDLKKLGKLPANARLVTTDATSMYSNIDTTYGLEVMAKWLALHCHKLLKVDGTPFPEQKVLQCLSLVMQNLVIQFKNLGSSYIDTSLAMPL
jgi:hypothetical protein